MADKKPKRGKKQKQTKFAKVMKEWKAGKLKSSSGKSIINIKQAQAIAFSESELSKNKKSKKR